MFEKVSRSLKYDSNIFFDHKHIIGERAKRARHSQVCSIENRIYIIIMVRAIFVLITRKVGGA